MRIAVLGATGTLGSLVMEHLRSAEVDAAALSRSTGVDALTGDGLDGALVGADAVIDTSNPFPPDGMTVQESFATAAANLAAAARRQGVRQLVLTSIVSIDDVDFDDFDYYVAKRDQESAVRSAGIGWTILRSAQWFEFAENPSAIVASDASGVQVLDSLIRPVAADTVAAKLVELAQGEPQQRIVEIAGPDIMRLPALTEAVLRHRGDQRTVTAVAAPTEGSGTGTMLPTDAAEIAGPDLVQWLKGQPT